MSDKLFTFFIMLIFCIGLPLVVATTIKSIMNAIEERVELPSYPLKEWTFQDHEWVTYNSGGLAHHPDCPCKAYKPQEER